MCICRWRLLFLFTKLYAERISPESGEGTLRDSNYCLYVQAAEAVDWNEREINLMKHSISIS